MILVAQKDIELLEQELRLKSISKHMQHKYNMLLHYLKVIYLLSLHWYKSQHDRESLE